MKNLDSLLSESFCFSCGKIEEIICKNCMMIFLRGAITRTIMGRQIICLTSQNPVMNNLIFSYKDDNLSSAYNTLSFFLAIGLKFFDNKKIIKVVNIPTSYSNLKKRGIDPISEVTRKSCLMAGKNFKYFPSILKNSRDRLDQVGLDDSQRELNIKGAFICNKITKKPIIIVDDLITSGKSISESIFTLQTNGNYVLGGVAISSN